LCGKSELAKIIAYRFAKAGFNFIIESELSQINQFFKSNILEDKIAILEDPWGHITQKEGSRNLWRTIEEFVKNLPPNHKLIITSRIEIIHEIYPNKKIEKCAIDIHSWNDLTIDNPSILIAFWRKFTSNKALLKIVEDNLSKNSSSTVLQIGQLKYLASSTSEEVANKKFPELEFIARANSEDIAQSVKEKDADIALLLSVLALCATTIHGLHLTDLAYILDKDKSFYSILKKRMYSISFKKEEEKFPEYKKKYGISDLTNTHISYLEERNFIKIIDQKIFFTHPNYYEAGRALFYNKSTQANKLFFGLAKKCLSCLNPKNVYLAAQQLPFLINIVDLRFRSDVIQLAFHASESIFPAVEDSALIFLSDFIEELSLEEKQKVITLLEHGSTGDEYIYWHKNEIPFISTNGHFTFPSYFPVKHSLDNMRET
jgi:hypothetical protein